MPRAAAQPRSRSWRWGQRRGRWMCSGRWDRTRDCRVEADAEVVNGGTEDAQARAMQLRGKVRSAGQGSWAATG